MTKKKIYPNTHTHTHAHLTRWRQLTDEVIRTIVNTEKRKFTHSLYKDMYADITFYLM